MEKGGADPPFLRATKGRRCSSRGRVAIAFAAIGYKTVAFDSALPMLTTSQSAGQPDPRCRRGRDSGSIREGAGSQPFHPGARSEAEIGDFLVGFERMDELRIGPGPSMALL